MGTRPSHSSLAPTGAPITAAAAVRAAIAAVPEAGVVDVAVAAQASFEGTASEACAFAEACHVAAWAAFSGTLEDDCASDAPVRRFSAFQTRAGGRATGVNLTGTGVSYDDTGVVRVTHGVKRGYVARLARPAGCYRVQRSFVAPHRGDADVAEWDTAGLAPGYYEACGRPAGGGRTRTLVSVHGGRVVDVSYEEMMEALRRA